MMLTAILLTCAIVVFAWMLPWRDMGWMRSGIVLVLAIVFCMGFYLLRGYHEAYLAKQSMQAFDDNPNESNLAQLQKHLSSHIQKHDDDALAYVVLGRLHFVTGDYVQAANAFGRAYKDYPDDRDLWLEYAAALYLSDGDENIINELMEKIGPVDQLGE